MIRDFTGHLLKKRDINSQNCALASMQVKLEHLFKNGERISFSISVSFGKGSHLLLLVKNICSVVLITILTIMFRFKLINICVVVASTSQMHNAI